MAAPQAALLLPLPLPPAARPEPRDAELLTSRALLAARTGQAEAGCALITSARVGRDRGGRPYLALTLRTGDRGFVEARGWRYPYPEDRFPAPGRVYRFEGTVASHAGAVQLVLRRIRAAPASLDSGRFAGATRRSHIELCADLTASIERLDADLAALVGAVLHGEVYERFCVWPAAQTRHGAVRHGLLAHSLRVASLARQLAAAYAPAGLQHDAGLVGAACLLHDVGKVYTLPAVAGAALPEAAARCDHVTRGVLLVQAAAADADLRPRPSPARLDALLHAILAHHGRREWGAPVEPATVEAWLVHLADLAEARLWAWSREEAANDEVADQQGVPAMGAAT